MEINSNTYPKNETLKPGKLRKKLDKRTDIVFKTQKFKDQDKAEQELDRLIGQGIPVACQVDFYYMDYIPQWERVHANIHFITVVGKEGDDYLVSDSYYPKLAKINRENLRKARKRPMPLN